MSELARLKVAQHFVMEIHIRLGCAYAHETWVEHIEWLEIKDGKCGCQTDQG